MNVNRTNVRIKTDLIRSEERGRISEHQEEKRVGFGVAEGRKESVGSGRIGVRSCHAPTPLEEQTLKLVDLRRVEVGAWEGSGGF